MAFPSNKRSQNTTDNDNTSDDEDESSDENKDGNHHLPAETDDFVEGGDVRLADDNVETSSDSTSHHGQTTRLRFPFLDDDNRDPLTSSSYFKLTLGGSMARQGDESHLKTLQKLYPDWYDPEKSKHVRQSNSPTYAAAMTGSNSLSVTPTYVPSSPMSSLASPTWPRPTHRLLSSDVTGNMTPHTSIMEESQEHEAETEGDVSSNKHEKRLYPMSWVDKQREDLLNHDLTSQTDKGEVLHADIQRSLINMNLSPTLSPVLKLPFSSASRRQGLILPNKMPSPKLLSPSELSASSQSVSPPPNFHSFPKTSSRTEIITPSNTLSPTNSQTPTPRYRKSPPTKLSRAQTSPAPFQPSSITPSPRDRRSSTSSQGRRSSVVERLLGDVTNVPDVVGVEGLLQRRRRVSRRMSDQSTLIKLELAHTSNPSAGERLSSIMRTVRIITGVCRTLRSYVLEKTSRDWSFVEMYLHLEKDITPTLVFNPHDFSKIQPPKGGRRLEQLLSIPTDQRTPQDIQNILAFVRTHTSFNKFPAHMQVKMCAVMQYQSYEARRIVIREGHPPSAFYLVLSGSLIVNIGDVNPTSGQKFVRTLSYITEGDCFGEIALLEQKSRTATIVCKTKSELLVIYKEDFDRLILQPLLHQRDADIDFCLNHALFEEIPRDVFYTNPQYFFYQYFPKDTVVVADSSSCPFLILIKSGVCQVVGSYKKSPTPGHTESRDGSRREISADLEAAFPLYTQMKKMAETNDVEIKPEEEYTICKSLEEGLLMGALDKHTLRKVQTSRPKTSVGVSEIPPPPRTRDRSLTLTQLYDQLEQERKLFQRNHWSDNDTSGGQYWSSRLRGPGLHKTDSRSHRRKTKEHGQLWRVLQEDVTSYAEIATLIEGCVFGLETLVGRPGPSVSLVSGGAECLIMAKKLFLQSSNIKTLRLANDLVMVFPSPATLERKVKENKLWERYKNDLIRNVTSRDVQG